jgi:epoxyqueuosine reductase
MACASAAGARSRREKEAASIETAARQSREQQAAAILRRAVELGATGAGIVSIDALTHAPSYELAARSPDLPAVVWPEGARTVVVIALAHPREHPELDWWSGRIDPPGNRLLAAIVGGLCEWIPRTFGIACVHLPYHVEKGGIYLKDAAVLAGLGSIGRNNLLVVPGYGPLVRLRALTLDVALPSTGPVALDPCAGCPAPCQAACPRGAFGEYERLETERAGPVGLPGGFSRTACFLQMDADIAVAGDPAVIRYCRACELSCTGAARVE